MVGCKYEILYLDETKAEWVDKPLIPTLLAFEKIKNFYFLWWEIKIKIKDKEKGEVRRKKEERKWWCWDKVRSFDVLVYIFAYFHFL